MEKDVIALIGAGQGGRAILSTLVKIPDVEVKYVCDVNPDAPGIKLAKKYGIQCFGENWEKKITNNSGIDMILEVTGIRTVYDQLNHIKAPETILIGAQGTKIIFTFLDSQEKTAQKLRDYKNNLEILVHKRTEDLEKANKKLEKKILQHKKLNKELQKINDAKTRYLLQATHQFKAPFAAIQSYTDVIMSGYAGEITDKTRNVIEKIKVRSDRLSKLIKEMLELTNLKTFVRKNLKIEEVNLEEIIKHVFDKASDNAKKRNIKLNFKKTGAEKKIKSSKDQTTILFIVLTNNAIDYSKDDSTVEVVVNYLTSDEFNVQVIDHGIGIQKENLSKIFEEYFRANEAVRHYENGTGLGLAIVKEIAAINKFKVKVASKVGEGSTFTVSGKTV